MTNYGTIRRRRIVETRRNGSALMDVVAASILTVLVMVPAVNIMRRSHLVNDRVKLRLEMTTLCGSLIEQEIASMIDAPKSRQHDGKVMLKGQTLRYQVTRSDSEDLGGVPDELSGIFVTVWHDADGNKKSDKDESEYSLFTKVSITPKKKKDKKVK